LHLSTVACLSAKLSALDAAADALTPGNLDHLSRELLDKRDRSLSIQSLGMLLSMRSCPMFHLMLSPM